MCCFRNVGLVALSCFTSVSSIAQNVTFSPVSGIQFTTNGPVIRAHVEPDKPFTVAGEHGVLVGQQDGSLEAWLLPVKLLSHLTIEANIDGYTVPIDVNRLASEIEVRPDRTTITYSHTGFTIRQIMFSPNDAGPGTGPVVLFSFDCLHPTDFIFRFTPNLEWMWPERNEGVPGVEWVRSGTSGYYVLHSDYPDLAGAVTIPGAQSGILAPYQERPQVHPVELKLHIDPTRDRDRIYPLLMAIGTSAPAATTAALGASLAQLNATIPAHYKAHLDSYRKLLAESTSIKTPDEVLDEAFQWAVVAIEQLKTTALPTNETALVAGYYSSGDSARPGFGWFFGRDALYTLFAVNGYGDFKLSKNELEFLIHRQRADGKIMHEYSQTAAAIDWQSFPYMYAAADSTPLFLLAVADYVRSSGDFAFLATHRSAVEKAWEFETSHAPGPEKGGNGIYNNTQGTGWVESWPTGMPHQEIYLAFLDQQASGAMAQLETLLNDAAKAEIARQRADAIAKTIDAEFYDPEKSCYIFSRNADATRDRTSTVYPALAWWTAVQSGAPAPGPLPAVGTPLYVAHPDGCLRQLAAHTLNTDWGLRDVAGDEKFYDGMSYHQGSVWPLFTGWAALAEYRGGQPLAGYQMLMENANLTRAQDLGAVTELLSGDFFVPFGRSTSHQLWSSAMVITPTLRGLFGIDIDAVKKTITLNPHLPASWDHAEILNLALPGGTEALYFTRKPNGLEVYFSQGDHQDWQLRSDLPGATIGPLDSGKQPSKSKVPQQQGLRIPLPAIEVDEMSPRLTSELLDPTVALNRPPLPGARTARFRILRSDYTEHKLVLTVEGLAGTSGFVDVVRHSPVTPVIQTDPTVVAAKVADLDMPDPQHDAAGPAMLTFHFPAGDGWKTMTVTLTW
jgi:glycogen debranching enzyme